MILLDAKKNRKALKRWWYELRASGDFVTTLHSSVHSWPAFKEHFKHNALFVTLVEGEIVSAFWVHPWLDGVEIGYWMRAGMRLNRRIWKENISFLSTLVKRFPVVVACTVQEKVVHLLKNLGFREDGTIPDSWDGLAAKVLWVTEANFNDHGFKAEG